MTVETLITDATRWKDAPVAFPASAKDVLALAKLLNRAYAEIRKQTFGSRVVFDREIVELAEERNPDRESAMQGEKR